MPDTNKLPTSAVRLRESIPATQDNERRAEAELLCLLDAVDAGVLLLDDAGRIRFANGRLGALLGIEKSRLVQLGDFAALAQAGGGRVRTLVRPAWELFEPGQNAREQLEVTRPDRRLLERAVRPVLASNGRRVGWLELYRDVTGQDVIQAKLLQTEKMAAIGQLVSGIAHELNNPLTGIMGYAQLLLGRGLAPAQLAEAQMIHQEAERARRIVKNLSLFAHEAQLARAPVDLNEVVERTLALRSYELRIEEITVELNLDPDLPQTRADAIQLQQVMLNLLVNSEQAILEGRGRGRIRLATCRMGNDRLALEVADDGPGVPPEVASRIFDPFFTTKPAGIGTGLGLSIAYGIIQQHGGEIYLESRPGWGAVFVVELPILQPDSEEPGPRRPERRESAAYGGRILVVEDEPTVAQLIADVLREEQHDVDVVLDSQEGLNRLTRKDYDLVICDLKMPRLNGRGFYQALVSTGSRLSRRLLFVTGDTLAPQTIQFLEKTRVPYLAKPFLVEELKLAVNRLLGSPHDRLRRARAGLGSSGGESR